VSGRINLTGRRFGRLVLTEFVGTDKHWNGRYRYRCDCGNKGIVQDSNLRSGSIKSCGCLKRERIIARNTSHGLSGGEKTPTRLYRLWLRMRARCQNPAHKDYAYYGGRGISVCPAWSDFATFHAWAFANGYRDDLTIDRVDNDGNYEPGNCRWATRLQQARNSRNNRLITFRGKTMTAAEWEDRVEIRSATIRARLDRFGWTVARALTTPVVSEPDKVLRIEKEVQS
jgi:hypothetical protein